MAKKRGPKHKVSFEGLPNPFEGDHAEISGTCWVHEAKSWLWKRFREGFESDCPCCGQTVKCYPRSINRTMLRALILVASRKEGATSRQINAILKLSGGGDHGKLEHWGLMNQVENGALWHITELGRDFLAGRVSVPRYAFIYNKQLLALSIERVHVRDCDEDFVYEELMDPAKVSDSDKEAA